MCVSHILQSETWRARSVVQAQQCYVQTGKPPDQMVLDNNDEVWYDEAEEVDVAVELEGLVFPLRIGKNLQGMSPCLQAL